MAGHEERAWFCARPSLDVSLQQYAQFMQPEIEVVEVGKNTRYMVRYQCPWCHENSCITASRGVEFPQQQLAFLVVCEVSHCRRPAMVIAQVFNGYEVLGTRIFGQDVHPSLRPSYREPGVPTDIARDFQEALLCQAAGCHYAAALVARRVLQAAARDVIQGERRNLFEEINAIPAGRISDVLRASAHVARDVGNDAAHASTILAEDVESLMVFTEQVLEALYVQPAKLADAQARRAKPATPPPAAKKK